MKRGLQSFAAIGMVEAASPLRLAVNDQAALMLDRKGGWGAANFGNFGNFWEAGAPRRRPVAAARPKRDLDHALNGKDPKGPWSGDCEGKARD